jgi:hypothetical protein
MGEPAPDDDLDLRPAMPQSTGEAPEEPGWDPTAVSEPEPGIDMPHLQQVGNRPNPDYPDASILAQQKEAAEVQGEVSTTGDEKATQPAARERHVYHFVLTERRGAQRRGVRTVVVYPAAPYVTLPSGVVAPAPALILPLDQDRRRATIQVAYTSGDGYFVALGGAELQGFSSNFLGGVPNLEPAIGLQSFLMPLRLPNNEEDALFTSIPAGQSADQNGTALDSGGFNTASAMVVIASAGTTAGVVQLQGSMDGINWYVLATDTLTAAGVTTVQGVGMFEYLRAAITTPIVGGTIQAQVAYSGDSEPLQPNAPLVYESVRELYACFVPDQQLAPAGQFAVLSIMSEIGDPVGTDQPTSLGQGGDR